MTDAAKSATTSAHGEGDITTELRGHIFLIGLNRPEKYNGLTPYMFDKLADAYEQMDSNPDVHVGILFAHGAHFTAGLDLPKFTARMADGGHEHDENRVDIYGLRGKQRTKPLITAVKGITYTAGLEMALASDMIIAARGTRFSQLEPKRAIMATGGATFRFVERGGWGNAMRWLLTGDEFSAEEAHRIGIVQEIVADGEELNRALEIAARIAACAPLAVQATIASARTFARRGQDACIADFVATQKRMAQSEDFKEGVQSFIERRTAQFTGK